ncbi:hypothetical protein [Gordonia insulae]|uniref:DUF3558 domain-containing protein n=1 Tax=Gordonia insulae TaxID=2420509 RepID=A0A3G8JFL5_9ACTN|nr:hypothetical protein [Gordonia insulae]AZG43794.1 hypothetical protein D7316_00363 [Gordonia insulae]
MPVTRRQRSLLTTAVCALVALCCTSGCARSLDGQAVAAPSTASSPTAAAVEWRDHVVPSDCILTGAQMSALSGVRLKDGEDTDVKQSDGTTGHNCSYYTAAGGVLSFTAVVKVQAPVTGTVTPDMLADLGDDGARSIPGIGLDVIIEPLDGPNAFPTMRVATDRHVTSVVLVVGNIPHPPDDAAWSTAARQIVAALPAN